MPIEINARLGGSEAWSMINAAHDVDILREHMNISLGFMLTKELRLKGHMPCFQCISLNFRQIQKIFLESIHIDVNSLENNGDAIEVALTRSPGQILNGDIMGWVTVRNELNCSLDDMNMNLKKVLDSVEFMFYSV